VQQTKRLSGETEVEYRRRMDKQMQQLVEWMKTHESALDTKMKEKEALFMSAKGACHAGEETVKGRRTQEETESE
jgi:hypothetical protein